MFIPLEVSLMLSSNKNSMLQGDGANDLRLTGTDGYPEYADLAVARLHCAVQCVWHL